jgi:hypothetical protein
MVVSRKMEGENTTLGSRGQHRKSKIAITPHQMGQMGVAN